MSTADAARPHWKMALLTWVGVNPAILLFSSLVPGVFGPMPALATLLVVNVFVVAALEWLIMPALTALFSRWLASVNGGAAHE